MPEKAFSRELSGTRRKGLWLRRFSLGMILLLVAVLVLLFLAAPPLVSSSTYKVNYFVNDIEYHDGKVYRALALNSKTYIFLPQVHVPYRYIGIDWGETKAFAPFIYPEPIFGWACVHQDAEGPTLNNPKLGDEWWEVKFRSDGVDLFLQVNLVSSERITVHVSKN